MLELFGKLFGSANERAIKKLRPDVQRVNALEAKIKTLSDVELQQKPLSLNKIDQGAPLDSIRHEASQWRGSVLACAWHETLRRSNLGGFVLHSGQIAEMKTGEGKHLSPFNLLFERHEWQRRSCGDCERLPAR